MVRKRAFASLNRLKENSTKTVKYVRQIWFDCWWCLNVHWLEKEFGLQVCIPYAILLALFFVNMVPIFKTYASSKQNVHLYSGMMGLSISQIFLVLFARESHLEIDTSVSIRPRLLWQAEIHTCYIIMKNWLS